MLKSFLSLMIASAVFAPLAQAYIVAVPADQAQLDFNKATHALVSGRGSNLGTQPQVSALSKAKLYRQNFPAHQVVLFTVLENDINESRLVRAGWRLIVKNDMKFETRSAVNELKKYKKIRSLELFGHNSPILGTQTDGKGYRFDARDSVVAQLKPNFDQGAYAIVHGCNSGWIVAPTLARTWNIPVSGSFTGTRFEKLHSDGHFYVDEANRFPNVNWAVRNDDLGGTPCGSGGCLRMRPAFSPYNGEWGNFAGPILSHYKFFCPLDQKECEKRMALSLYGYLNEKNLVRTSTRNEFREVVKQHLCPVYSDRTITNECYHQLDLIDRGQGNMKVHFVVNAAQLSCNFAGCTGQMVCSNERHNCQITGRVSKDSETLAQEFLHYMAGFEALRPEDM